MKKKLPIYTPTKSLDVKYNFISGEKENAWIVVEGDETHALLNTACKNFIDLRNINYTTSVKKVNFATASLTFLYTDTSIEEGYLGDDIQKAIFSLNIPDNKNRIFSTSDFYTQKYSQEAVDEKKNARCTSFNYYLAKRIEAFSLISDSYHIPVKSVPITSAKGLTKAIAGAMFHETFHHTEQTVMHYLSSDSGIKSLVNTASSLKASYFYGIVLDLHSQRMVCGNCNVGLLGMQNTYANQGFIVDLNHALEKKRIEPRINGKTMLSTRVNVSNPNKGNSLEPLRLPLDSKVVHEYDANQDNQVFQALDSQLGLTKIKNEKNLSLQSYKGAFFTSSALNKVNLEKSCALPYDSSQMLQK